MSQSSKRQSSPASASPDSSSAASARKRQRKNSTRACDICKTRKSRCDGTLPCARCTKFNSKCTYDLKYTRGTYVMPMKSSAVQTDPISSPTRHHTTTVDHKARSNDDISRIDKSLQDSSAASETPKSSAGDEYLSESSRLLSAPIEGGPVDPLEVAREKAEIRKLLFHGTMQSNIPVDHPGKNNSGSAGANSSTFWFNDSHLGEIDSKFLALPSKKLAYHLTMWYFDNASPSYRILHRPLVYEWIECGFYADPSPFDLDETSHSTIPKRTATEENVRNRLLNDHTISAVMFSIFAMGCLFPVGSRLNAPDQRALMSYRSRQFFLIAQSELRLDPGPPDMLIKLQAQFNMCLYLLTTSRVKAAWNMLVRVKNIASNLDLNRRDPAYGTDRPRRWDLLGLELRKRCFWAAYTLETYMCTMLGKSLTWAEEDITVDLPAVARYSLLKRVSDSDGNAAADMLSTMDYGDIKSGPSLLHSPIAHAKISKIIRTALRKLYFNPNVDRSSEEQEQLIDNLAAEVVNWEEELPSFLRLNALSSSNGLKLPYARQIDVIHVVHAHALILIYRPSLNLFEPVNMAARQNQQRPYQLKASSRKRAQQEKCLDAALEVADMGDFSSLSGSNWYTSYVVFCSITVMFVYLAHNPKTERRKDILDRARKLCDVEMRLSTQSDMAKRYVSALKELWRQVRRYLSGQQQQQQQQPMAELLSASMSAPMQQESMEEQESSALDFSDPSLLSLDHWDSGLTPPDLLAQIPSVSDIPAFRELQQAALGSYYTDPSTSTIDDYSSMMREVDAGSGPMLTGIDREDDFNRMVFTDILESLAQSFQGFDSAASVGFSQ
ncbi:hypothetical protein BZA70DRAFT_274295 [Myxozyma melibiosi]|uniref:Zn(2)-C6 fungal-type domain-containing protein n=1 Tax=Myxozyma melibiosi TaxID=54550 RepID=A0ABR1F9E2_9ASCO